MGPEQALLFGCYRFYWLEWAASGPTLHCLEEGLFSGDDLGQRDPAAYPRLARYADSHPPAVEVDADDAVPELRLHSRSEFVERVLWRTLQADATVVTFNAPFDLSRLALGWATARSTHFRGGFSFPLSAYESGGKQLENRFRPRLLVRQLDSKRARIRLARGRRSPDGSAAPRMGGAFLDCRTLAYALTGEGHSLESACEAFGVGYRKRPVTYGQVAATNIDYCREDVAATACLYRELAREYERWQLALAPTRAYSPASLAKACLREAGVTPPLRRQTHVPPELLGWSLVAYYGGRAECRIRHQPVPVVYSDYGAMYANLASLLDVWRYLTFTHIDTVEDDPAQAEDWLTQLTVDECLRPGLWPRLCGFALVEPRGEPLPVRVRYSQGGSWGIGVNPLHSAEPLWYTLADLAAARLVGGHTPRLLRVVRLRPEGQAASLRPLRIRGSRPLDPSADIFGPLVEERRGLEATADLDNQRSALALKAFANSAAYGIHVELNRQEPAKDPVPVRVHGLDSFDSDTPAVEEPGEYFFPPLASLVTGAGRLLLALLERLVADTGGSYAFCDTDSMAIVATRDGGLVPCPGGRYHDSEGQECVRALSWAQVDEIRDRFQELVPSDEPFLELEQENLNSEGKQRQLYCYPISAKRYCLYTLDRHGDPVLIKWSGHALAGFYLDPTDPDSNDQDWVREAWQWILCDALRRPATEPAWLDLPALTRFTASHPRLLRPFTAYNRGKPYPDQVKPANFLLVAHVPPGGYPPSTDPARFALIAPYTADPAAWAHLAWRNVHNPTGPSYRLTTETIVTRRGHPLPPGVVGVRTYRDVLDAYRTHPELKSLAPDGRPCGRTTQGLLGRRPVQALSITHIGKETNLLDEIEAGLIGDDEDVLTEYVDLDRDPFARYVIPILHEISASRIATHTGLNLTTVKRIRSGRVKPSPRSRTLLTRCAAAYARQQLSEDSQTGRVERDDLRACAWYLARPS